MIAEQPKSGIPIRESRPKRILLAGATGYIGAAVAREMLARGYDVTALGRRATGIAGCEDLEVGDLRNADLASRVLAGRGFDAVISCIASRSGEPKDAWRVDYEANRTLLQIAENAGAHRFLMLSAICVQRPKLAFQEAKLAFEALLRESPVEHTIVRPTAFFKSLSGQIDRVLAGKPFLVFGTGTETACKPICETDLARFMIESFESESARNKTLPIGGPGPAMTPRDQGSMLFELTGQAAKFRSISPRIFCIAGALLSPLGAVWPAAARKAELARIGHYYATESMLVWDQESGRYDAEATPSSGSVTLRDHYQRTLSEDNRRDELGDHRLF